MRCDCCEAGIPETSMRMLCPPCAQAIVVAYGAPHLVCKLHARQIHWEAWDNHPVRLA